MSSIIGRNVEVTTNGTTARGTIASLDASHYHAVVNGRTVYNVRWNDGSFGGGWEVGQGIGELRLR